MARSTRNIETLIADGGDINIGALPPHECAATAADGSNCLAMLVRRDGETFNALLKRLDKAIGMAWSDDLFIDDVFAALLEVGQLVHQVHHDLFTHCAKCAGTSV